MPFLQDISMYNQHEPEHEVSPFYCNVCQRDCESAGALDMHLKGKPHMKKVGSRKMSGFLNCGDHKDSE